MSDLSEMPYTPKLALVVTPHPDDAEIGCGGTVARWVKAGAEVVYLLCTNGDKGSSDNTITSEDLAPIREKEQEKAANLLGVKELVMLHYPDGELEDTSDLRKKVVRSIRQFRPDVVLCPDPYRRISHGHRDHRIVGQVTADAVFPYARDRLHFGALLEREGLEPHKTETILFWGTELADTFVDITNTIETKIKALLCHDSQIATVTAWDPGQFLRQRAQEAGDEVGVMYAEVFRAVHFRG